MDTTGEDWADRVRERAHALWESEGRPEGLADRHWARAEEELRAEGPGREGTPGAGTEEVFTGTGAGRALTHRAGIDV